MKNLVKWLLPLLLGLILTAGLSGAAAKAEGSSREKNYVYTEADHALLDRDVFARISEVEASAASTMKVSTGQLTEEDYAAMVPAVIEAVQSSKTYVQGSMQRNGSFLVWQTTVGIPCCYSPRMEAKRHHTTDQMSREEMRRIEAEAEAFSANLRKEASVSSITPGSVEIGLIQPFWESNSDYKDSDFLTYSPYYKSMWASLSEATGGSSDYRFTMENATIDHIASAMENCALVMLDSHGSTDYEGSGGDYTSKANCSYLCLSTSTGITREDTQWKNGPFGMYADAIRGSDYSYVSGQCIVNHMNTSAPDSFVYAGICLGMATDGICKPLRANGVEAMYGYSESVTFYGEKLYMQTILESLKNRTNLAAAVAHAKDVHGNWDPAFSSYSFSEAVEERVAFPVVVSSEDEYPGQGNVSNLQTVSSTWELFGNPAERSYTVRFVDYDGSELQSSRYKVGEMPSYNGAVPVRADDTQYTYTFAGWDPEIAAVTADATYTAVYDQELKTYEITWLNWDGTVLEADPEVPYGEMPSYDGDEPTREADDAFTYSFAGWTPELTAVTADASYTAEYVAEEIETPASVLRIYGNTRYQTSMKIADELKEALGVDRFDAVILATGAAFADALGGSYLSAVKKAPILLIREKGLNTLRTYIRENVVAGGTIYILGGTGAVPDEWVEGLDSFEIKRLSGNTRYATNLAILRETGIEEGAEILVATGKSFADSLSASSAGKPVLLVNETLYKSQKTFLDSVEEKGCTYTILGGASAVSEELQAELEAYTGKTIGRIAGNTRYSTTVLIAERYFPDASSVLLATAEQYPDGLCAGPLGAVLHSPVILCTDARTKNAAAYCAEREIHDGIVLGGPGVLADDTARTILDLSEDVEIAVK